MNQIQEKEVNKRKIVISIIISILTILVGVALFVMSGILNIEIELRILFIVLGLIVTLTGIGISVRFGINIGTYECLKCNTRFVPTIKAYIMGIHTIKKRKLKCPNCGEISYCVKRLTH